MLAHARLLDIYELAIKRAYTNGVNVGLVASKGLSAHALTHVPQLSGGVASSRHKGS